MNVHEREKGDAQRMINNVIAFLSSLVSGAFTSASPCTPDSNSDSSLSPSLEPSRDDACSSPARRLISTSSAGLGMSSSTSLCRLATCVRCRSSSGVKKERTLGRSAVVQWGCDDDVVSRVVSDRRCRTRQIKSLCVLFQPAVSVSGAPIYHFNIKPFAYRGFRIRFTVTTP